MASLAHKSPRIRVVNACAIFAATVLVVLALVTIRQVLDAHGQLEDAHAQYDTCLAATQDLLVASDYLTAQACTYVVTHDERYLDDYIEELGESDRRGKDLEVLREHAEGTEAFQELQAALSLSDDLSKTELYAMRLSADAAGVSELPPELEEVQVLPADAKVSPDEAAKRAQDLVLGDAHGRHKDRISSCVDACAASLMEEFGLREESAEQGFSDALGRLNLIVVLLLGIVVLVIVASALLVLWPISAYATQIDQGLELKLRGAHELRRLAVSYNAMYRESHLRTEQLKHAAEHDSLTGALNRRSFDQLLAANTQDVALIIVDVDLFKEINDSHGHEAGDKTLRKVAHAIARSFRSTDFVCRIGGDEFAVILTDIGPAQRDVIARKLGQIASELRDGSDGVPEVTLSFGVAFGSDPHDAQELSRSADQALYLVKEHGRDGYAFYGEDDVLRF